MSESKFQSFKLEKLGEISLGEGISKILNGVKLNINPLLKLQPIYLAECGCNDHSECPCVDFYGCEGNWCSCHPYDFMEDDCAKHVCPINCHHGIWGI